MDRALDLGSISTRQRRIAQIAEIHKDARLNTLSHNIDIHWLFEAWRITKKSGAGGVDGISAREYESKLHDNLDFLLERFKSGEYYAPPVKRAYIPKENGEKRKIGVPTVDDKVLQRAVHMLLEPIYELMFYNFSFGFRKGKNQHQALEHLWQVLMDFRGGWVLSVDIKGFFDTVRHADMREFLARRVGDGVIRRMVNKWLKAGVLEGELLSMSEEGTPQGGVISPLLSNIYLHYVLDEWLMEVVRPRLRGACEMIRFADDFLIVFSYEKDARRVADVIVDRFSKYGLTIHPEKTKLIDFRRPFSGPSGRNGGGGKPGKLEFLGFMLHWGRSRKGNWVVRRKTAKSRFKRSLKKMDDFLRENRFLKIRDQWEKICIKMKGHYQYFGVTGNYATLQRYAYQVRRRWLFWLRRRSQRQRLPWERFREILKHLPLPKPHIPKSVYQT